MAGPDPAPESLVRHSRALRALARSLVADEHLAEDLAQDAWIAALQHPPRDEGALRGWLRTALRFLAGKRIQEERRRKERERAVARTGSDTSTLNLAQREEELKRVVQAVLGLDDPYRTAVLLRYFEGLRTRDIARRLGIPQATVQTRLRRAIHRLRERMDAGHDGGREGWCIGLASLVGLERGPAGLLGAGASTWTIGSILVSTGTKVAIGALLVGLGAVLAWRGLGADEAHPAQVGSTVEPESIDGTAAAGHDSPPEPEPRTPAELAEAGRVGPAGVAPPPRPVEEQAPAGLDVKGVVVDWTGTPVAGADVFAAPHYRALQEPVAQTDRQGRFQWSGEAGTVHVCARAPGYAPSGVNELRGTPGSLLEVRVQLPGPGGSLLARVLDPDGLPVEGVPVEIGFYGRYYGIPLGDGSTGSNPPQRTIATGIDGRFEAEGLALGRVGVRIPYSDTWATWSGGAPVLAGTHEPFEIRLSRGGVLVGRVTDEHGAPVPAQIHPRDRSHFPSVSANADGEYRADRITPGRQTIVARHGRIGEAQTEIRIEDGQVARWDAVIQSGYSVHCRVVDMEGKGLPGYRIDVRPIVYTGMMWPPDGVTGPDGRVVIHNFPSDRFSATLYAPEGTVGFPLEEREEVHVDAGELVFVVEPIEEPSCWITGRVVNHRGQPPSTVRISIGRSGIGRRRGVELDPDGAFEIGPLVPGPYDLVAWSPSTPTRILASVDLPPEERADLGVLRLPEPGRLTIYLDSSNPERRAWVLSLREQGKESGFQSLTVKAGMGNEIELPPGRYEVQGAPPDFRVVPFEIQSGQMTDLHFTLDRD